MKYLYTLILIALIFSCKNNDTEKVDDIKQEKIVIIDTVKTVNKTAAIEKKQENLIKKVDQKEALGELITEKKHVIEKEDYSIDFKFPVLNTKYKSSHKNFNDFIENNYINITKTEQEIIANKQLCDSIAAKTFSEKRFIDYKIYSVNKQTLSVVFYKESFYSGAMHPSYTFDCFNFDLDKGVFIKFNDFFIEGSEKEVLSVLNNKINTKKNEGELYYDCWELSELDFINSKNNFVLKNNEFEFFFDDCVMCPAYTGSYSIKLSASELNHVLKENKTITIIQD